MPVGPHAYLSNALDPVARDLDRQGAPHVIVGYLPGPGALHFATSAGGKEVPIALRALASAILNYADELDRKPSIIIPGRVA